ncbi:mitochondrial PGP phosphatase-domain-containing protein [Powellomyces hirtus]|nr:mitochondrial PGP phosphatase-domain-containing protein [Powellomyces hirtus]
MVQSLNVAALSSLGKLVRNPSLLVPHLVVRDIRSINFPALKAAGIKVMVFDKDNTVTAPYVDTVHPPFQSSWTKCKEEFGANNVVIVSNSAGTLDDVGHEKAKKVEDALGVSVYRHDMKKPAGGELLAAHYSCPAPLIAVVGDRLFTDIVYGNACGMMTIYATQIVTEKGDNPFAAMIRHLEHPLLRWLQIRGVQPPEHQAFQKWKASDFML